MCVCDNTLSRCILDSVLELMCSLVATQRASMWFSVSVSLCACVTCDKTQGVNLSHRKSLKSGAAKPYTCILTKIKKIFQ